MNSYQVLMDNLGVQMAAFVSTMPSGPGADLDDEIVKFLMIFSGAGLLLSLCAAIAGIEPAVGLF
jgi:hypothetical protein